MAKAIKLEKSLVLLVCSCFVFIVKINRYFCGIPEIQSSVLHCFLSFLFALGSL